MQIFIKKLKFIILYLAMIIIWVNFTDASLYDLGAIIVTGLIYITVSRSFTGFVNPSIWLFQKRFIIYGLGYGALFPLFIFFLILFGEKTNNIFEILLTMIIGGLFFGIIAGLIMQDSKNTWLKEIPSYFNDDKIVLSDYADLENSKGERIEGRLLLGNKTLYFYSKETFECLFETALSDVNPIIEKKEYMKIPVPTGISLPDEESKIYVNFPYYWMNAIKMEKDRVR